MSVKIMKLARRFPSPSVSLFSHVVTFVCYNSFFLHLHKMYKI